MTYVYSEINQHDARYDLAREYPGGIEMLAKRMRMSVNVLRNKLAPRIKTHHINDEEDSLIIEYCQEANVPDPCRALIAKNWRHGLIAIPVPQVGHMSDEDLTQMLCKAVKEFSEFASEVSKSIADRKITPDEDERMEKEVQEAFAAMAELRERWKAKVTRPHTSDAE